MSTEIANLDKHKPSYLAKATAPNSSDEFLGGVSGGMPLPVVSVRGKEFRFRFQGQEQNTRQREMQCILVAARPKVSKRFYASQYSSGETAAPDCASADGVTPDVAEPVNDKCATCPKNAWGSKITDSGKEGKACQDYKRLVVLPLIDGQIADKPCVLDVAPTSLKAPKGYKGDELFLREYLNALGRHDIPPTAAVTTLGFSDAEYPQLIFNFARFAEEDEYNTAQGFRDDEEVKDVLEGGMEASGPVSEAEGKTIPTKDVSEPEPEAKKEQPKKEAEPEPEPEEQAYVFNMETDQGAQVPKSKVEKYKAAGYIEVPKSKYDKLMAMAEPAEEPSKEPAEEPSKESAPEPEAQEEAPEKETAGNEDDSAVLDEISKLLGG